MNWIQNQNIWVHLGTLIRVMGEGGGGTKASFDFAFQTNEAASDNSKPILHDLVQLYILISIS